MIADRLLATLKRHNPAKVRAYTSDDDARDIAVPTRRKKWSQVIAAIMAASWSRVELLDKSGAVLGYVENEEPAGALEELAPQSASGAGAQILLAERIAALALRAQREALSFRDQELSALLKAQGDVVREMTSGMRALTALYQEQVRTAEQTADLRAEAAAAAAPQDQVAELLAALPQLLQLLPALRAMLGAGPAATVPGAA